MASDKDFIFRGNSEIIPKRFEAIIPAWEALLAELGIESWTGGFATINQQVVENESEETLVKMLSDLLKKVQTMSSVEEKITFTKEHQVLGLALRRAQAAIVERQ